MCEGLSLKRREKRERRARERQMLAPSLADIGYSVGSEGVMQSYLSG